LKLIAIYKEINMIKEQQAGMEAVQVAALLCQAVQREMLRGTGGAKLDKRDRSPVTVADFGAQAVVCRIISQAFPNDAIVGEEDSQALREPEHAHLLAMVKHFVGQRLNTTGLLDEQTVCEWIDKGNGSPKGRYWVLDPIDGTKGFLRNDQYAIALALIEDGAVQWAFLGCPSLPYEEGKGQLLVAGRGAGTSRFTLDGHSLGTVRVSQTEKTARSRLAESFVAAHTNRGLASKLKEALAITTESLRMDSQAKYAALAAGEADIYLRAPNPRTPNYREKIWDHAAGSLVVEEAGGTVTDIYGRPLDWSHGRQLLANVGIVATNGHLHEAVIAGIAKLLSHK
jgi:3'(2'), 5'-bisphosphate nucleotidase